MRTSIRCLPRASGCPPETIQTDFFVYGDLIAVAWRVLVDVPPRKSVVKDEDLGAYERGATGDEMWARMQSWINDSLLETQTKRTRGDEALRKLTQKGHHVEERAHNAEKPHLFRRLPPVTC